MCVHRNDISVAKPNVGNHFCVLSRSRLALAFRHMREQGREGNVAGWMKTPVLVGIADRQPIVGLRGNTVPVVEAFTMGRFGDFNLFIVCMAGAHARGCFHNI